jgi:hypothetical protein
MSQVKKLVGQYPTKLQGIIKFTGNVTGTFAVGETVTGGTSGMTAKVVKWNATTKELTVKNINKDPVGAETVSSASGSAAVATVTSGNTAGLPTKTGGWNIRVSDTGITRTKAVGARGYTVEVMVASSKLNTFRTDVGTIPVFTLTALTSTGPYDVSDGDLITFTITANEAIKVVGTPQFGLTVGGVSRTADFVSINTAGTIMTFAYPVVAGDQGTAVAGYQVVNVGGAKTGVDSTGLTNDATVYTASISVDGVAKPIAVTGSAAQTYATLISEINTDLGASATAALVGGNIRVTSATTGSSSTVAITDTDLFGTLTGYVAILTAVAGTQIDIAVAAGNFTLTGDILFDVIGSTQVPLTGTIAVSGSTLTQNKVTIQA